jgi:superoxide reductase
MPKLKEVYKCNICGNIVELLHAGMGELVCCGAPMVLRAENTEDAAQEKHVPVMEKTDKGVKVSVGEVAHPMETGHYIEWIEISTADKVYKKFLQPGDEPVAEFEVSYDDIITVREYCNLHGLWKA